MPENIHSFNMYTWTCINCGIAQWEFENGLGQECTGFANEKDKKVDNERIWETIRKASNS